ncbi:MAG TPA: glycosyltransferase family 4 protein [Clostridia bacterium]|nr:glycosyltransferase family 4 protein [Clostridia bacterium]
MKPKIFELSTVDMTLYKFVLPLMKELRRHGFDVICGARGYGYLDKLREEGFKAYDIALSRSLNPIALSRSFFQLIRILREEEINILHVHTPIASFIGRLAAFFAKVDIKVYTVHGFVLQPRVFYFVEKLMARTLTDYMFTVNQEDLDLAVRNKFIAADKAININSVGIDTEHFDPCRVSETAKAQLRESLNIRKGAPVIGYVGRIVKSKGVLDLVRAFVEIRKAVDCQLLLVGPWDLDERPDEIVIQDIRHIISGYRLEQEVLLTGHREDIAELLGIMDIFVLPSYREGMPVSLLEAMAMEKAVIGTDIRGSREAITADSGLIYEAGDIEGLIKHMKFYLDNLEKAAVAGKNARQRVLKEFSMDRVIEKQMKVFLELFNDGKS